jgi:hypothetical protein
MTNREWLEHEIGLMPDATLAIFLVKKNRCGMCVFKGDCANKDCIEGVLKWLEKNRKE